MCGGDVDLCEVGTWRGALGLRVSWSSLPAKPCDCASTSYRPDRSVNDATPRVQVVWPMRRWFPFGSVSVNSHIAGTMRGHPAGSGSGLDVAGSCSASAGSNGASHTRFVSSVTRRI